MAFQGDLLPGHPEALTRIRLSVLRLLNIIKDLPAKEISELANKFEDFKERQEEARKQKEQVLSGGPADEVDMDIEEDKQQPFDEPSVLYDEVLGGLEDEVVILEAEDDDSWLNNAESRHLSYSINPAERRALELEGPILN
ncbi:uncharacterized protein K441DRAFT_667619 [Cenococcum geophilum 1.58]|uniref:uncharacterized protein n=1 Tax=Cenococcum geophilum 1.58 TaxID=794803 RepID=UPI00358F3DA4|nr:hypothetical protein K441DRAFT_667619 [Cenococcum geophilum 1.58]